MADTSIVVIREMRGQDIEPLAEALDWPWRQIDRRWQELVAKWREMFVADIDGRPVASVSINERPEQPGLLHLFALDVAPSLQNRGIGTRLIEYVEAEAHGRELDGVYLEVAITNANARRLYERLGYVQQGVQFVAQWNYTEDDGTVVERIEDMVRLVKRFGSAA
jgi:ribosomal-protein-alanine N-acetyltransferase